MMNLIMKSQKQKRRVRLKRLQFAKLKDLDGTKEVAREDIKIRIFQLRM